MYIRPDYEKAREEREFDWFVAGTQGAMRELAAIPIREFNLAPDACIEAYRRGRPALREMFGPDVSMPDLCTPAISYGHANALGSSLIFPDDGEVGHTHPFESLEEAIAALREPVEFASVGMTSFYLEFQREMQRVFPEERVGWGFGYEGPLTTAYEMRGEGFFLDIYDQPEQAREFLCLLTKSIVGFHAFHARQNGEPPLHPETGGMADDVASMIPPALWDDLVIPYWEQYYEGLTTGRRIAHVEDLRPVQLPYLETIGLSFFDPSISPQLNPPLVTRHCRVPYTWRLGSIHYPLLSEQDIRDFVFRSVADGASRVHSHVSEGMCNDEGVRKVQAFIDAAKEVDRLLDAGANRSEIESLVSESGRNKFWDHWWK